MITKNTGGLILGLFFGAFHLLWSLMVALGWAQPILNWVYSMHFLNNPFTVAPFNVVTALMLVAFTFVVGYVAGFILTMLWEKMHGKT